MNSTEKFIEKVRESGRKVTKATNGEWLVQCPGHADGRPSLTVRHSGQMTLLNCFAGCQSKDIAAAVGLSMKDLFDNPEGAVYNYYDNGKLVRSVMRTPEKKFFQKIVDGERVVLYVPEGVDLAAAVKEKRGQVFIVEGEKDADTLASLGINAVSSPMGAGSWHKCDYSPLYGIPNATIVADDDKPGMERAEGLYAFLKPHVGFVEVVKAAVGKDATDHVMAGKTVFEFVQVPINEPVDEEFEEAVATRRFSNKVISEAKRRDSDEEASRISEKLSPKPLSEILSMDTSHDWLVPGLLERRDRFVLTGTEGMGKSHLLRQICVTTASGLHPFTLSRYVDPLKILVVDAENSEKQWARGARYITDLAGRKGKVNPVNNMVVSAGVRLDFTLQSNINEIHKLIDEHDPDILYIGPLYKLVPKAINTDDDAAPVIAALDSFRERGVTMLMEAHAGHTKLADGKRDLRPRGSAALLGWPEFGFGIQPDPATPGFAELVKWRGDREEREWPSTLYKGKPGELPWEPGDIFPGMFTGD